MKSKQFVLVAFTLAIFVIFFSYKSLTQSSNNSAPLSSPHIYSSTAIKSLEILEEEEVVIVTAGNQHFFDRLENLIGSVHLWEPKLTIVVYDLGLTSKQISVLKRMCNIQYLYKYILHNAIINKNNYITVANENINSN